MVSNVKGRSSTSGTSGGKKLPAPKVFRRAPGGAVLPLYCPKTAAASPSRSSRGMLLFTGSLDLSSTSPVRRSLSFSRRRRDDELSEASTRRSQGSSNRSASPDAENWHAPILLTLRRNVSGSQFRFQCGLGITMSVCFLLVNVVSLQTFALLHTLTLTPRVPARRTICVTRASPAQWSHSSIPCLRAQRRAWWRGLH